MNSSYKNLIWTDHALSRMRERGVKQSDAYITWKNPQKSRYAKTKLAWVYYKTINNKKIEVVAKKNTRGEWVILSVWSKPVSGKGVKKGKSLLSCIYKFLRYNKLVKLK